MAKIGIDLDRKIGSVDRRIFGNFVEHLGRCIYGGLFEEGSPLSDERGFRRDVLEVVRRLRVPILRWPGGNFVSGYHWLDGVGPRAERPRRVDLAWFAEESNRFGTDEFIQYCRAIEAEPYICVNLGSGSMDEAQAWVEYANSTGNTHWANLRRKHGSSAPHGVKYWGLGNEMYGGWQIGALEAQDYVKKARAFGMVMQRTDPNIVLVSCGQNGWNPWDEAVLEGLAPMVGYHSIHLYTGHSDYYVNVFQPHQAERAVRICERAIERVRYIQHIPHPISIAFDEWNVWYRTRTHEDRVAGIEERYNLADALAVATFLNIFIRYCRIVRIANFAQLVNAIAPIFTNKEGLFLQTIYHPLRLYSEHTLEIALDVHVDCEVYDLPPAQEEGGVGRRHQIADLGPFKLLDAAATCDAAGRQITLAVVNRDRDRQHKASIQFAGGAGPSSVKVAEVNGVGPEATNSFDQPEAVGVREQRMNLGGSALDYVFPAHSVTLLRFELA